MTEEQQALFIRVKNLMMCVNDTRLLPQERSAAYYTMQKYRTLLQEQGIMTRMEAGQIELISEICYTIQEN